MRRSWKQEAGPIWSLDGGDGLTCLNTGIKQTDSTTYVRQCDKLNYHRSLHLHVSVTFLNMHEEVN
jgi:hypothetical protein